MEINVADAGSGYTEDPAVSLDAPPPATIQTLWSNNGTSTEGGEPGLAISLPVSDGVFSVILGDTSLDGMNSLPAATFDSSPLFLRVWFDDGESGFEQLSPDQPITATPYAMQAASVTEGAITSEQIDDTIGLWTRTDGNLTATENVGIGVTDPEASLQVVGTTVLGYGDNTASGENSFVSGGGLVRFDGQLHPSPNTASGKSSFVAGGMNNAAIGDGSFVGGGNSNSAVGSWSSVNGGGGNVSSGSYSFVGGGSSNTAGGDRSFTAGYRAKAEDDGTFVWADATGGAFESTAENQFLIRAGGGVGIGLNDPRAALQVLDSAAFGQRENAASGENSFVSGGGSVSIDGESQPRPNAASGDFSFVGGGMSNAAIGGQSFVGGGESNGAVGLRSAVSGGMGNISSGKFSFVGGGAANTAGGDHSFAAGHRAKAAHNGTFVWASGGSNDFASTATNQFLIQASGGVGINTTSPQRNLDIRQTSADASEIGIQIENTNSNNWAFYVAVSDNLGFRYNDQLKSRIEASDGAYVQLSDAREKNSIEPIEAVLERILQLQPSSCFLNEAPAAKKRSIGLIAQEVQPLFPQLVSKHEGRYGINYSALSVLNTAALSELEARYETRFHEQEKRAQALDRALAERNAEIVELSSRVAELTEAAERNEHLEERLAVLEKLLQGEKLASR